MRTPQPATVESVRSGLQRLIRDVGTLTGEVAALTAKLGEFKSKNPLPRDPLNMNLDYSRRERPETDEPHSDLERVSDETMDAAELAVSSRVLRGIGRDLDGGLRDIRAARRDFERIAEDTDTRDRFRARRRRRDG